ncbi:hypothetical protein [Actinoplanes sp. NPDC049118]|uniref:hypothetical protein n=1 Tax=Actinoplanes sp. NPDC049118 TaxID=3155769 RepID=UPI0033F0CCC1
MTRTRIALTLTTLGLSGLLALTACGVGAATSGASPATGADVAEEAYALQAVGLETALEAGPAATASAGPADDKQRRHPGVRRFLRKNTLHGELTVQGKDGVRTVVVQRGTVTAVDATTVSVKSSDGFALTWTLGDKLRVVQDRKAADAAAIKTGAEVGVAGAKDGDKSVARLIAIK